jgi:hypothetical protein
VTLYRAFVQCSTEYVLQLVVIGKWHSLVDSAGLGVVLEDCFGDHAVDFMVPRWVGSFSRILVDFSVACMVDFSVGVSVDWLSVGFDLLVGLDCVDMAISLCKTVLLY